jgi:hypothetical protein
VLKKKGLLVGPDDPKHVWIVSTDGIPEELKDIEAGMSDATVSAGKTFKPGPTDHDSTIIEVRPGVLEDQLAAPFVTRDGAKYGPEQSVKFDDKSLWGNDLK